MLYPNKQVVHNTNYALSCPINIVTNHKFSRRQNQIGSLKLSSKTESKTVCYNGRNIWWWREDHSKLSYWRQTYLEDMRTYRIAQYEPELAEILDIHQISSYHYRTWTNPKSPNLWSTQEEPAASDT